MHQIGLRYLSIRLRLALGHALFVLVILAAISAYLLTSLENNTRQSLDDALRLRASRVVQQVTPPDRPRLEPAALSAVLSQLAPLEEFAAPGIYVQVLDPDGRGLASSPNLPGGELPVGEETVGRALAGYDVFADVPVGPERVRVFARPLFGDGRVIGAVLVGESLHALEATLRQIRQILIAAGIGAAALSVIGSWSLTSRALRPLRSVTRVARHIAGTGRFAERIPPPAARDEVGEMTTTFNEMLDRLEQAFRRQREFLADASHELRGPLTVIKGNLDLLKRELPHEDRMASIEEAAEEVRHMTRLVSELLFLSVADAQETVQHLPVLLHEVVADTWERAKELDAGLHDVLLLDNDPCVVQGDGQRLRQMLWNLVENGLRYTANGGTVTLALRRHEHVAELSVADTGIGISSEHLPRLFDRFYRVDPSRSRHQGGTGLGLAIVKQIAEAHRGQVRVRSDAGLGTTFSVVLPLSAA